MKNNENIKNTLDKCKHLFDNKHIEQMFVFSFREYILMNIFEGIRYPILDSAEINKNQIGVVLSAEAVMLEVNTS